MLGIRQKLSLGFAGLLLILAVIGVQSITQLSVLGHSIDVILRENYRSVVASQQMQEALERLDSGALFSLLGDTDQGDELIAQNLAAFETALQTELGNITLPGETEKARLVQGLFERYRAVLAQVRDAAIPIGDRREAYFGRLHPLFHQIKDAADSILHMNQQNMIDASDRARATAAGARLRMHVLLASGAVLAVLFFLFTGRWVLRPINRLIYVTDEIRRGNLDVVVQTDSHDEIGRLSGAFNEMASSLRELRRSDRTQIVRIQRSTLQVFKSLPDVVALIDLDGKVEISTEAASEVFGLKPGIPVRSLAFDWMGSLLDEAFGTTGTAETRPNRFVVQRFIRGEEHFFRPEVVPILDGDRIPAGLVLVLKDVTQQLHQEELKRGVVATVSHQLKTPLTSLRMAVHLLLEEKVGPLTPQQTELLLAARDDSERLHSILTSLLSISRIESGRMRMSFRPESPRAMVLDLAEPFRSTARDQGIVFTVDIPEDLPQVLADSAQVGHVVTNLLSNALKYTAPGGEISISATADERRVRFTVSDTGRGIPREYLDRVFEEFFRAPGQETGEGEGLGLAIAREIIEAHGGSTEVRSEEGRGSAFTFSLRREEDVVQDGSTGCEGSNES